MEALSSLRTADAVEWMVVDDPAVAGTARRKAMALAERLGFPETRVAEVGLAATEVVTNLSAHGVGGRLGLRRVRVGDAAGLELLAVDQGPGMAEPGAAAADGFSTSGTLGLGIGTIARIASEVETWSSPGQGTVVVASFWAGPVERQAWPVEGVTRAMPGQEECGDAWAARMVAPERVQILVADGLGHGPLAARASTEAVALFASAPAVAPVDVVRRLHEGLRPTRGAAVMVAELRADEGRLVVSGLGNIAGVIDDPERRRQVVSMPGIAGHQAGSLRELDYPLGPEATLVMHSDGIGPGWELASYPGLRRRRPAVVAAALLCDLASPRDDASVVVARPQPEAP